MQTQEQFLADVKTKIQQYIYRSLETSEDPLIAFLQDISGNGALNWHKAANKEKMAKVFSDLAIAISNYELAHGAFRTYTILHATEIIYSIYTQELFNKYVREGYGVTPESVLGSVTDAYSIAPPQNTDFPGTHNTANPINPEPTGSRLISQNLYVATDRD